jgi:hypothetical protein
LLVLIFVFFPVFLAAQQRKPVGDSVSRNLSVELEWVQSDTTEENEEYDDEEQEETPSPFLDQSLFSGNDSIQLRKLPDSLLAALRSDKDFWYANYYSERKENKFLKTLFWIIVIGGFAAFLIWYLAGSNIGLFRKAPRRIATEDEEIVTDNIFLINYRREIDKAVANANYRLAVRLMYLQLQKKLSEKNIIHYRHELTNFDYQLQLSTTAWLHDFQRVTRNYEYSWYGQFDVPAHLFENIRKDFENFEQKIN